jgi:hypothetical protein
MGKIGIAGLDGNEEISTALIFPAKTAQIYGRIIGHNVVLIRD